MELLTVNYMKKLLPQLQIHTKVILIMTFLPIKDVHIKLIKRGKISLHEAISKGKKYSRGKIFLKDSDDIGSTFFLYKAENMHIIKQGQHKKGKGYLVFIPT